MEHGDVIPPDSETLALLGKREILRRRFSFWSLFAFAVCELITWEMVLALFSQGLTNGGPAGLVYGFIIASLSTLYVAMSKHLFFSIIANILLRSVYAVLSELVSMMPIACGQYYFVYRLAPSGY